MRETPLADMTSCRSGKDSQAFIEIGTSCFAGWRKHPEHRTPASCLWSSGRGQRFAWTLHGLRAFELDLIRPVVQ